MGKTPEELWQDREDQRLEFEGYCRKIQQGLENQDDRSGIRAIWELVQNARDVVPEGEKAHIEMRLTKQYFIFSHHGKPFDYTSFRSLVKQDSSKDRSDADLAGQYGTGFMTTHTFNRVVRISAPYAVKKGKDDVSGYVRVEDFILDRSEVDKVDVGPDLMKKQLDQVKAFRERPLRTKEDVDDTTSFRYDLRESQLDEMSGFLDCAIRMMPFVLALNDTIGEVKLIDEVSGKRFWFTKEPFREVGSLCEGWKEVEGTIIRKGEEEQKWVIHSLRSEKGDVVIIPPFPEICGPVEEIPSLFLWFPLLGTEHFGVNFIFHSSRFYPVEKRNGIMLPGASQISQLKGKVNGDVLKEMMSVLFSFYAKEENAAKLDLEMCRVEFPEKCENAETQHFFTELQNLWKAVVPTWSLIPVKEERLSMDNPRVRVLHPDYYRRLEADEREKYEQVVSQYAANVTLSDGTAVALPDQNLFAWSEIVDRWRCDRDSEFFLSVKEVCEAIKGKGDQLKDFLILLQKSGNAQVLEELPLFPNRRGDLCLKGPLRYGVFMDDVYPLVETVMGDAADNMLDPDFKDVCHITPYEKTDLQKAISQTIGTWRHDVLDLQSLSLSNEQLDALIRFCSAFPSDAPDNYRSRIMPILVQFYEKEYSPVQTIKFRGDDEEEFYRVPRIFLLDYTLSQIEKKDADWVNSHKEWLRDFLTAYAPKDNDDRRKQLDTYAVLPNQHGNLCKKSVLKANDGVPDELVNICRDVCGKDLRSEWIDTDFESVVDLEKVTPADVAHPVEQAIMEDMKAEKDWKFDKALRRIIGWFGESDDWKSWFPFIDEKKAILIFKTQSGPTQKSLFSLMDNCESSELEDLARLSESGKIGNLIEKMESLQRIELEKAAMFTHLHCIGTYIERILCEKIGSEVIRLQMPENKDETLLAEDIQDGQDIIVRKQTKDGWKNLFYIEVKSKWNFDEPAHMSTNQVRMASLHPQNYALCCVDLRPYKNRELNSLNEEEITKATKVKMNIGETLEPLMKEILNADKDPDDVRIKIADYRSNIYAPVFEKGLPLDDLISHIAEIAKNE